jgi:RHS repeat-associated protein
LTSVTDRNGRQVTYSYDNAGRKTGETWVNGNYVATYTYDNANRLTVEQDTFSKYTLTYDNANRVTNVSTSGSPNGPQVNVGYGYDNFNNITLISLPTSISEAFTFDSDNRLVNLVVSKSSWEVNQPTVTMAYDAASRLTSMTKVNNATLTSTYSYDNADRLTGITHKSGSTTLMTLTYGYDNANQLTSYAGPDGSITYGYDNDGQLTGTTGAHNETYTYDKEGNRTMTGYVTSIGNRLLSDGTYSYTYDNDGNMLTQTRISDGQVTSYTWDFRNRLTEVLIKTSGGTTVQDDKFTYDLANRRIGKNTLSGGQSWTLYNGVNPLLDYNSSLSLQYEYLYGNSIDFLLGRADTNGNPMWYLTDKLGSVRADVNNTGSVIDTITYDTFGNIISESSPSSGDRFKYTSREWDSEIGQYFYRARYYSPTDGRFESEDPLGFKQRDIDFYRYTINSPVNASDATGQFSTSLKYHFEVNSGNRAYSIITGNGCGIWGQPGNLATGSSVITDNSASSNVYIRGSNPSGGGICNTVVNTSKYINAGDIFLIVDRGRWDVAYIVTVKLSMMLMANGQSAGAHGQFFDEFQHFPWSIMEGKATTNNPVVKGGMIYAFVVPPLQEGIAIHYSTFMSISLSGTGTASSNAKIEIIDIMDIPQGDDHIPVPAKQVEFQPRGGPF